MTLIEMLQAALRNPDTRSQVIDKGWEMGKQAAQMTHDTLNSPAGRAMLPHYGAVTEALPWAFDRIQQPIFRGAKEGSEARASQETAMVNFGLPVPTAQMLSEMTSLPQFFGGAAKGLVGYGKPVSGPDLLEGTDLSSRAKKIAGTLLQMFADPVNIATGGFAGLAKSMSKIPSLAKLVPAISETTSGAAPVRTGWEMAKKGLWEGLDSAVGRWDRTARSLPTGSMQEGKWVPDPRLAELDEKVGRFAKYDLDVPVRTGLNEPMPISADRQVRPEYSLLGSGTVPDKGTMRGISLGRPDSGGYMPYWRNAPPAPGPKGMPQSQPTLPHEYTHPEVWGAMERFPELGPLLEQITKSRPGLKSGLESINPKYKGRTATKTGEEILATWPEKALEAVPHPLLQKLVENAQRKGNNPALKTKAKPMPIGWANSGAALCGGGLEWEW